MVGFQSMNSNMANSFLSKRANFFMLVIVKPTFCACSGNTLHSLLKQLPAIFNVEDLNGERIVESDHIHLLFPLLMERMINMDLQYWYKFVEINIWYVISSKVQKFKYSMSHNIFDALKLYNYYFFFQLLYIIYFLTHAAYVWSFYIRVNLWDRLTSEKATLDHIDRGEIFS